MRAHTHMYKKRENLLTEFAFPQGISTFFLSRSSTNYMSPTHIMDKNLFFSKSTDLNVNFIKKIPLQQHLD